MQLISLMTPKLEEDGAIVKRAANDADTVIVSAALELARDGNSVTVFANDTDVIIMLLHLWDDKMGNAWIHSEYTRNDRKQLKQMNVKDAVGRLDDVSG